MLLGNPEICPFEVYNDFDRNLANLFRCMKERTMATIRELGFCHLNSREDFIAVRRFFENEQFDDKYLPEELRLTEALFPPPEAKELKEIRKRITADYDIRRAAMFLKLLRFSYSSSGKSYASHPFDLRRLFGLISQLQERMANVVVENQDFETLIKHYDRPDTFFYLDPPYLSTEDMYEVGFGWEDHVRLRDTLKSIKGEFLLSYNDCEEIRKLYNGFSVFDFARTHSMAQRYEAGKAYQIDLKQFCDFMRGRDCFDKNEINSYINMLHSLYKPKSAKRKIACIKAFYRYMEIEDIIAFNPFHKIIIKYKEPIKLPRTIPLNCIQDMLAYTYKQHFIACTKYQKEVALRNIVVLELLFSTGMRVSEISNLKISAINFGDNTICIFGKGSKERIMCINDNLSKTISNYLTVRSRKTDYLLVNRLGNRLSEQSIRYMVNKTLQAEGTYNPINPHPPEA